MMHYKFRKGHWIVAMILLPFHAALSYTHYPVDTISYGEDRYMVSGDVFEDVAEGGGLRTVPMLASNACPRFDYRAEWRIDIRSDLYLVSVYDENGASLALDKFVDEWTSPVKAAWYDGRLEAKVVQVPPSWSEILGLDCLAKRYFVFRRGTLQASGWAFDGAVVLLGWIFMFTTMSRAMIVLSTGLRQMDDVKCEEGHADIILQRLATYAWLVIMSGVFLSSTILFSLSRSLGIWGQAVYMVTWTRLPSLAVPLLSAALACSLICLMRLMCIQHACKARANNRAERRDGHAGGREG
jgi:hypothetical protein